MDASQVSAAQICLRKVLPLSVQSRTNQASGPFHGTDDIELRNSSPLGAGACRNSRCWTMRDLSYDEFLALSPTKRVIFPAQDMSERKDDKKIAELGQVLH